MGVWGTGESRSFHGVKDPLLPEMISVSFAWSVSGRVGTCLPQPKRWPRLTTRLARPPMSLDSSRPIPRDSSTLTFPLLWVVFRRCQISELGTNVKDSERSGLFLCVTGQRTRARESNVNYFTGHPAIQMASPRTRINAQHEERTNAHAPNHV